MMCFIDWIVSVLKENLSALSFFILMGMVVVFGLTVMLSNKQKLHTVLFLSIIGFYVFSKIYCGPNYFDVRVMKPMVEAISGYIVKHGVPERLEDIPGLPYKLEDCKKVQENLERCQIMYKDSRYEVELYILGDVNIDIYRRDTLTGLEHHLYQDASKKWHIEKQAYSSKHTGICNPMRQ